MEERTITLNSDELKHTSSIYSLIGRRFLNQYNVDRFYYHLIGKTQVKEFSERLLSKVSPKLKVFSVKIEEMEDSGDGNRIYQDDIIRTCRIAIVNTEICKRIFYLIDFTLYPESITYSMTTGIFPEGVTLEGPEDNTDDKSKETTA
nr:MAG TPA: hypothetical protein [Caudoviricetes sp.]